MSAMSAFQRTDTDGDEDGGWGQSSRTKQNWLRQMAVNAPAESRPCRHRKEARETF